jgi:hypothetical protein
MRLCVICWNWILVTRENIQIDFLQQMTSCWKTIADRGLGLFSRAFDKFDCPLSTENTIQRPLPTINPHIVWINVSISN